jgi:hypothetical protein
MSNTDQDVKEISDAAPSLQEQYGSAINASNLRVRGVDQADGAARILIAAAMSPNRLGAALMRLVSEWDGSQKPRRQNPAAIERLAATMLIQQGTRRAKVDELINGKKTSVERDVPNMVPDIDKAHAEAQQWYMHELGIHFQRLKTLPEVREQLAFWIQEQGIGDARRRAAEMLAWWLDSTCPVCSGRKRETISGTPSLSHRACQACKGTGVRRIPHSQNLTRELVEAWKINRHIDVCVKSAQGSLQVRLRGMRARPAKTEA